jgi:hypothetical protein
MKNYKITVHIPFYIDNNINKKNIFLKRVCKNYLKISKNLEIFIHTNKIIKKNSKKIKFIYHDFTNDDPYKLTWNCRKLMFSQKDKYEIFIFGEDDIIFSKKNFNYWLKYKDLCIRNNYNLGFLRTEVKRKSNLLYSTDQVSKIKYHVNLYKKKFAKLENSNSSFWIYDKNEFQKFTQTKYWRFDWKWVTISGVWLTREMAAVGWHGENMGGEGSMNRYKATIIPLNNHKLNKNAFIKHLSNKYANNPAGLFGTISINNIMSKKLIKFIPKNFFYQSTVRLKFFIYYFFRFNLKNLIKFFS